MSTTGTNLDVPAEPAPGVAEPVTGMVPAAGTELTAGRLARVGDIEVRRLLPLRGAVSRGGA